MITIVIRFMQVPKDYYLSGSVILFLENYPIIESRVRTPDSGLRTRFDVSNTDNSITVKLAFLR